MLVRDCLHNIHQPQKNGFPMRFLRCRFRKGSLHPPPFDVLYLQTQRERQETNPTSLKIKNPEITESN